MADNMLEGTVSFEAGFARATSGFAHSPRYTYGVWAVRMHSLQAGIRPPRALMWHVPVHGRRPRTAIRQRFKPPKFAAVEFSLALFF